MKMPKVVASYHSTMCSVYLFFDDELSRGELKRRDRGYDSLAGRIVRGPADEFEDKHEMALDQAPSPILEGGVYIYDRILARKLKREFPTLLSVISER
jgi:hypothetical protein